jgi:hypothetical protein
MVRLAATTRASAALSGARACAPLRPPSAKHNGGHFLSLCVCVTQDLGVDGRVEKVVQCGEDEVADHGHVVHEVVVVRRHKRPPARHHLAAPRPPTFPTVSITDWRMCIHARVHTLSRDRHMQYPSIGARTHTHTHTLSKHRRAHARTHYPSIGARSYAHIHTHYSSIGTWRTVRMRPTSSAATLRALLRRRCCRPWRMIQ